MRGRSSTDLYARLIGLVLLVSLSLSGCHSDPPMIRDAKVVAKEFSAALRRHDADRLRALAACIISTEGVRDARLRYLEPPLSIRAIALDSLAAHYASSHRMADSVYSSAPDSAASLEARFEQSRSMARRAAVTRAALRAADQSRSYAAPRGDVELMTIRAHVMVRFTGEAVGPDAIDRDTVVRLIRAPAGVWVVYAFDLASDSPGPLPY